MDMKDEITYADFDKLDIRVGTVVKAFVPEWSEKLLEFEVDFGQESGIGTRTILSGVKKWYGPEDFEGKQFVFLVNLAAKKMGPGESQGMMLMADTVNGNPGDVEKPTLIPLSEKVEDGTVVR